MAMIRLFILSAAISICCPSRLCFSQLNRIDPTGIVGTLILSSKLQPTDESAKAFLRGFSDEDAIVIFRDDDTTTNDVQVLLDHCRKRDVTDIQMLDASKAVSIFNDDLEKVRYIWIVAKSDRKMPDQLRRLAAQVIQNDGTVAISGAAFRLAFSNWESEHSEFAAVEDDSSLAIESDSDAALTNAPKKRIEGGVGWSLIPNSKLLSRRSLFESSNDDQPIAADFVCRIGKGATFMIRGRRCFSIGDSAIQILLPTTTNDAESVVNLTNKPLDVIALRRIHRRRLSGKARFAAAKKPTVDAGSLVIAGGGKLPSRIVERFVLLAGGGESNIVVLPTATPGPLGDSNSIVESLKKAGACTISILKQRRSDEVESPEFLAALKTATGVWFGGGRQWRFVDAYADTKAESAIRNALTRGGVIGGSSAGASIQGDYLARGNPLGNVEIMSEGYDQGFSFLPGTAIDQHFSKRNRLPQLKQLVSRYPAILGIGIDESTALVVEKSKAEVIGNGGVFFVRNVDGDVEIIRKRENDVFELPSIFQID